MAAQGEEFLKARLEKDLAELKKMIDNHFVQRKKDEEEIQNLEKRIDERKTVSPNLGFTFCPLSVATVQKNQSMILRKRSLLWKLNCKL